MSEQNIAVVRRWVELFNERDDAGEFLSLLDPEVELQTPGGPRLHGHDEAQDWFEAGYENVQPRLIASVNSLNERPAKSLIRRCCTARGRKRDFADGMIFPRSHRCSEPDPPRQETT